MISSPLGLKVASLAVFAGITLAGCSSGSAEMLGNEQVPPSSESELEPEPSDFVREKENQVDELASSEILGDDSIKESERNDGQPSENNREQGSSENNQSNSIAPESMFVQGCESFAAGDLSNKHLSKYLPIVDDICSGFEMDYSLVEVETSPQVSEANVDTYIANNVFGLSYWDKYVSGGLMPMKVLLLMEDEKSWWKENLNGLVTVTPEWFGPTDGGGHCYAAEAEAFCPKAYYSLDGETVGQNNVLTTMLGSKMDWSTFRKVVPIHEATHQFHSTTGLGHWRWWYIEGQATYFELAATVLVPGLNSSNWRDEIAGNTYRRDESKFNEKTVEGTARYMDECDRSGNCDGFRYFGGSLAHELLVNTYGMQKYIDWNLAIAERLPNFYWRGMDESVRNEGNQGFENAFKEFFGTDLDTWENMELASFVLETYSCEVVRGSCG